MEPVRISRGQRAQRWLSELWQELRARREGRQGLQTGIHRATRDVTGPTGWVFSNAWQQLDDHGDAYMKSFDRRLPPSIFVSERDRVRHGKPIPMAERCLEDTSLGVNSSLGVNTSLGVNDPSRRGADHQ